MIILRCALLYEKKVSEVSSVVFRHMYHLTEKKKKISIYGNQTSDLKTCVNKD